MNYITYENRRTPRVTIHFSGCNQIKKRGGKHKYGQGKYEIHRTYEDALRCAKSTKLPIKFCSYCKPPAGK